MFLYVETTPHFIMMHRLPLQQFHPPHHQNKLPHQQLQLPHHRYQLPHHQYLLLEEVEWALAKVEWALDKVEAARGAEYLLFGDGGVDASATLTTQPVWVPPGSTTTSTTVGASTTTAARNKHVQSVGVGLMVNHDIVNPPRTDFRPPSNQLPFLYPRRIAKLVFHLQEVLKA